MGFSLMMCTSVAGLAGSRLAVSSAPGRIGGGTVSGEPDSAAPRDDAPEEVAVSDNATVYQSGRDLYHVGRDQHFRTGPASCSRQSGSLLCRMRELQTA